MSFYREAGGGGGGNVLIEACLCAFNKCSPADWCKNMTELWDLW